MAHRSEAASTEPLSGWGVAVLDALPIGLYVVDRKLRVVAWNRGREQGPHGRPKKEVLGRSLRHALGPRGSSATGAVINRVFETGQPHEETVETIGSRLHHVRRLPVYRNREVAYVLSLFEDITDQRAIEMRLIASDRLAFLGQLVAGVAHEVSNPLAGIAGCAEALWSLAAEAPGQKSEEAREFRDLIRAEVARCERIVRSLLDAARPHPSTSADLATTVQGVLRLLERHPMMSRIRVKTRIENDLVARIDPDSLTQVVLALALNAARAMPSGGTLSLRGAVKNQHVVLDVTDTGAGVSEDLRTRIFEPFFTTDPTQGTGLGLAIARSLVRGRGGDLLCCPRRRRGACFRVTLRSARI